MYVAINYVFEMYFKINKPLSSAFLQFSTSIFFRKKTFYILIKLQALNECLLSCVVLNHMVMHLTLHAPLVYSFFFVSLLLL